MEQFLTVGLNGLSAPADCIFGDSRAEIGRITGRHKKSHLTP